MELGIALTLLATLGWGAGDVFARKAMFGASATTVLATMIALSLFAWTAFQTRDPLQQVLTGLSAVFLMREIHFYGSHRATYLALMLAAIWIWR